MMFVLVAVVLLFEVKGQCSSDEVRFGATCLPYHSIYKESMQFLRNNLPSFDVTNMASLGFACNEEDVDGLEDGVANIGTQLALTTRNVYSWAGGIPLDIFNEYVLPYANVNEARSNWRPYMRDAVSSIIADAAAISQTEIDNYSISEVALIVNKGLWSGALGKSIVFKGGQTPLIYDPMSIMVFGYASCTGVSIVYIDALRSVGIPSRLAGTPAWHGDASNGNHNWVEVWVGRSETTNRDIWQFVEAWPAGAGESLDNPCDKWFCRASNMNGTEVYAARWLQTASERYPMAWDINNAQVPGVRRTDEYQSMCNSC